MSIVILKFFKLFILIILVCAKHPIYNEEKIQKNEVKMAVSIDITSVEGL